VDVSIVILAFSSLFFTWKYIYEVAVLYNDLKLKFKKKDYEKAYKEHKKDYKRINLKNVQY
jgi:hypothetical protein